MNLCYYICKETNKKVTMRRAKNLPSRCPACGGRLHVASLHCAECDTRIEGDYRLPVVLQLSPADQQFVLDFVKASGSLKEMARLLELSYPTVRNRLDDILARIAEAECEGSETETQP